MKEEKTTTANAAAKKETASAAKTPATATATAAAQTATPKPTATPAQTPTAAPAKPETTDSETAAKIALFAAELQKQESFDQLQKRLTAELEKLNQKKQLAEKRETLISCRGKISEYIDKLKEVADFETSICRLSFEVYEADNYNRESFRNFLTVSNTGIVSKFCEILQTEICKKVEDIEKELLKA